MPHPKPGRRCPPINLPPSPIIRNAQCTKCHQLKDTSKPVDWLVDHFKQSAPQVQLKDGQWKALAAFQTKLTDQMRDALASAPDYAASGAAVYQSNNCFVCHQINGVGMKTGPPLSRVAMHREKQWVIDHFNDPQKMSPGTVMPPALQIQRAGYGKHHPLRNDAAVIAPLDFVAVTPNRLRPAAKRRWLPARCPPFRAATAGSGQGPKRSAISRGTTLAAIRCSRVPQKRSGTEAVPSARERHSPQSVVRAFLKSGPLQQDLRRPSQCPLEIAWQGDFAEQFSRVQIVVARLVNDTDEILNLGLGIPQHGIQLPHLEGYRKVLISQTHCKSLVFPGH